ncbi:MAG TPA: hypothetical protein VMQ65_10530 [Candidatus Limnocylindria bacterium]|nr:hypothetical protein [Candidatus Limnocylindria bacterium]
MRIPKAVRLAPVIAFVALLTVGCLPIASETPAASVPAPSQVATSPSPWLAAAKEIGALVNSMAAAVLAGDRAGYLALVDLSNPTFALEHTRWVDDWSGSNPASEYALEISELVIDDYEATGQMAVNWLIPGTGEYEYPRTTSYQVRFTGGPGAWRYAGEDWVVTQVEHFRIQVAPGLDGSVPAIVDDLPSVYDDVTAALEYAPASSIELKLYAGPEVLVANTLLSLPPILGWNEPGEALKLRLRPDNASLTPVIAHEFVHFLCFDRAGTQRTRMPWWLDEGVAGYVAEAFEGPVLGDRLDQVVAWHEAGELADWRDMAVFEETPQSLWQFVYPQGYAMVRYVTERYGASVRNAWLASMATEMTIDEATPAAFGLSFDELDASFRDWLADR